MTEQTTDAGAAEATPEAAETVLADAGDKTSATAPEAGAEGKAPEAEATSEGKTPEGETKSEADAKGDDTETTAEELTFTPPEGLEVFKEQYAEFSELANGYLKENPEAKPADVLKWAADEQAKRVMADGNKMIADHNEQIEGWLQDAKKHPEIGGDKFEENTAAVIKTLETLKMDDLREHLDKSGLGNHPDMLRLALLAGRSVQGAKVLGPGGPGSKKTFTDALYGQAG